MARSVPEWIGSTPDAKVPDRVKARVFERHEGRCHITGRKITPGDAWELEHILPLWKGGEHRESNLAPALVDPHKGKSKAEARERAKSNSVRKRHLGLAKAKRPVPGSRASKWAKRYNRETGRFETVRRTE